MIYYLYILHYFRKGRQAAEVHRKLCKVYGIDALSKRVCQKWFAKFRRGDFNLNDASRSGRLTETN